MIIIMGPVGSGKSEQTSRLAKRLNLQTISTRQLLEKHMTNERQAKMLAGDLVDDQEIIELVSPELESINASREEFILDGFPRSIPQARWMIDQINQARLMFTAVIKLNVSDETVLKRLMARGRSDDTKDIIKHRLETYRTHTDPVVKFLRENNIEVNEIEGEQDPDKIEQQIKGIISEAQNR